uniref:Proline-specific permease (Proline transport protein) n=1 Tax=Candidozyma auris TaxID=498019 RepID=A0A0L0NWY5_CANAR
MIFTEKKSLMKLSVSVEAGLVSSDRHYLVLDAKDFGAHLDVEKFGLTKRKLTNRHVLLMIIGQSIGTGLFVGIKTPLMNSGSLSLFLGFFLWAASMIWPLMLATGEMCSYLPVRGTFLHFAARWLDPALGFAVTMMYLYTTLMFICVEAVAFASVAGYWTDLSPAVFVTIFLASVLFFNVFGVNWYGEIEFCLSILKVLLIVGLMFFGLITMCGGNPKGDAYGFRNWKEGGLVKPYLVEGNTGKFLGFWNVLIFAAFSCGGPDMLGMVSGEISQPRKNIATAAKRTYIRIFLFYVGGIFFVNSLCASNNPDLLAASASGKGGAAASPWVIGIKSVGVNGLDSVVNAVVLTSAWSCGNGFTYGAARSAYSAALAGYIPKSFSYCLKSGCPIVAVVFAMSIGCLSYMTTSKASAVVLNWFINLATTGLLCTYAVMWMCYFKFKKATRAQPCDHEDPKFYKLSGFLYPWVTYWAAFLNALVLFFNGFWIFFPGQFSVANLFTSYFAPVFFMCLFGFWKIWKKTHWRSAEEADITSDKADIDDEEEAEALRLSLIPKKEGFLWKVWYKVSAFCFS